MILYCPRCGAELTQTVRGEWLDTSRPCPDCGVSVADPPALLAPSDAEITYGLDEWPVVDRATLTGFLAEDDTPYRWEPGIVLVVPDAFETVVDGILDDLEGSTADTAAPDDPPPDLEAGVEAEPDGPDLDVDVEVDGDVEPDEFDVPDVDGDVDMENVADGGEEAQAAMSDLFVTADRLQHSPSDAVLGAEIAVLADAVGTSLPPYGVEEATWVRIHELALAVDEAVAAADIDVTVEHAVALRDYLRPYV